MLMPILYELDLCRRKILVRCLPLKEVGDCRDLLQEHVIDGDV